MMEWKWIIFACLVPLPLGVWTYWGLLHPIFCCDKPVTPYEIVVSYLIAFALNFVIWLGVARLKRVGYEHEA
jgi:hypothetical protein